jgi:hypothetical protein
MKTLTATEKTACRFILPASSDTLVRVLDTYASVRREFPRRRGEADNPGHEWDDNGQPGRKGGAYFFRRARPGER